MTFTVELRSREQILGDLIRSILANTDLNDVAAGSTLATLLEGIASSQYRIAVDALKILENSNLESLVGASLDQKAESMRLPNGQGGIGRIPAGQSSGVVTIGSGFVKQSTKFYAGKPAPFAGTKKLYVESAAAFPASGRIYIGRGTADRFEGPIQYISTSDQGSFWLIELATPLTKNHLYSDGIVLAQGGDRPIAAGTICQTPASNEIPSVAFSVTATTILADGEAEIDVPVSCTQFGEVGNALAGSIREFVTVPFPGSTVTNKSSFINGRSTESDENLRKRIKNYPSTLSRGTDAAILAALSGIIDPETGRAITSSTIVKPAAAGEYSKVYIDDGSGLEPTFGSQPYEMLLRAASGQEAAFRTAQAPISAATAIGAEFAPFVVESGMDLSVVVDGVAETYSINPANYANMNAATAYEIVRDFNSQANLVGFRTFDGGKRIVMTDLSGSAESLQVLPGTLQKILGFPTAVIRPIFVYKNSEIQSFRGRTATLITNPYPWNFVPSDLQNLPVIVDGVMQSVTISNADFFEYATDIAGATITQWQNVLRKKVAGVNFEVAGNVLIWTSRQINSPLGSLQIPETRSDGSPSGWVSESKMWTPVSSGGVLSSTGSTKDFDFNRFTGELRFSTKPDAGSSLEIGSRNTRAILASNETLSGLFALSASPEAYGSARMVLGFDGEFAIRDVGVSIGDRFVASIPDASAPNVIRLTLSNHTVFKNAQVGDYVYILKHLTNTPHWGDRIEGIYRLKAVGMNVTATPKTYTAVTIGTTQGSNIITVTMPDHGLKTGGRISVNTTINVGGISAANINCTLSTITVLNSAQFTFVAGATATATATGVMDQMVYDPDAWVEFEVSSPQLIDWTLLLGSNQNITAGCINLFKSEGALPQIVDFGDVGVVTVDAVIDTINAQVACGEALKLSGTQLAIRSNDWEAGTVAALAVVGTAANLMLPAATVSQQSHTAYSTSGYTQSAFPVVTAVINQSDLYPSQAYLHVDKDLIDITMTGEEPVVVSPAAISEYPQGFEATWITGRQYGLTGRVYNNQVSFPYTGILRTTEAVAPIGTSDSAQSVGDALNRYGNYVIRFNDLAISSSDRFTIEMDLDAVNKTVSVPLYKTAAIQDMDALTGNGRGQVVSFRLKDPDDENLPFFDNTSTYKHFDFSDFRLLVKNVGLYRDMQGINRPASGSMTALPVDQATGIVNGDSFTLNDGTTTKTFEFDTDGTTNFGATPVPVVAGKAAQGSLTAIGMGTNLLSEGDSFTLSDGVNPLKRFEFDSDGSVQAGSVPVPYIAAAAAKGSLSPVSANPTTGIAKGDTFALNDGTTTKVFEFTMPAAGSLIAVSMAVVGGLQDGDTFTIHDGSISKTFEFDTDGSVTPGNVAVAVGATDVAPYVKMQMLSAINAAGLNIAATSGVGNTIDLINNSWSIAGNQAITESIANSGVTLTPIGMIGAGGTSGYVPVQIKPLDNSSVIQYAMRDAINGSGMNITASLGSGSTVDLTHTSIGLIGNQPITESMANAAVSLTPIGMSGGLEHATADTIKQAIIDAVNGAPALNITAGPAATETTRVEHFTITAIDISNGYLDLAHELVNTGAVAIDIVGGGTQEQGTDFTVTPTNGVIPARVTLLPALLTLLVPGDVLRVVYPEPASSTLVIFTNDALGTVGNTGPIGSGTTAGVENHVEFINLTQADLDNGYVTLYHPLTETNTVAVDVIGGGAQAPGIDWNAVASTLSTPARIELTPSLIATPLIPGDVLRVLYSSTVVGVPSNPPAASLAGSIATDIFTLEAGDLENGFVTLTYPMTEPGTVSVDVIGAGPQVPGLDYNAVTSTLTTPARIVFAPHLLGIPLVVGDIVRVIYTAAGANNLLGNGLIETIASGASMLPVGLQGGVDGSTASQVRDSMVTAINGAGMSLTASAVGSDAVGLVHGVVGTIGNQSIIESLTNGTLSPVGMSGGNQSAAVGDRALVVRSVAFGAPACLRPALRLPTAANQSSLVVAHANDFVDGVTRCSLYVTLASKPVIAGSMLSTGTYSVTIQPSGNLYQITVAAPGLNPAGQYQPGNILNIGGTSSISGSYLIIDATPGIVSALAPSNAGLTGTYVYNANQNPVSSFMITPKTFKDIAKAITDYLPANPIATAEAIGSDVETATIVLPSFVTYTADTAIPGVSMSLGLAHHTMACHLSGSAGIWQYDSSNPTVNNIKATVQSEDALFPTILEAAGTTYSPIDEQVMLVPSNSKTLAAWLNFNAASSLPILAEVKEINSSENIQISSRADGSSGGVRVTGVTGNGIETYVAGNGTNDGFASRVRVLSADAQALVRGHIVRLENGGTSEILRPYRLVPTGAAITSFNTESVNTFFRQTNSVKYIRTGANTARLVFYRYGMGPSQLEPMQVGDQVTLTALTNGVVRVSSTGILGARTGDMMYVKPGSAFPSDVQCIGVSNGFTDNDKPEYLGYPVIRVIDGSNIEVLAPNITTFGVTVVASQTDLVFIPAIYNEKNIRTNKKAGAQFTSFVHDMRYLVKTLGNNMVSVWAQNSDAEATDTMKLSECLVNTDDWVTLGTGFDSANQGTFKVIAHNGRNHIIFYNPIGGKDEILDKATLQGGGAGQNRWAMGPLPVTDDRPVRIVDAESVRIGDRLRISTPLTSAQWFPASMIGSWRVIGLGYSAITQATGTLTPVAANPTTGIKDGDTFTMSDGDQTYVFEFDTNGQLAAPGRVGVVINPTDPAGVVAQAMVSAINGLGANFGISATLLSGVIYLSNRRLDSAANNPITEVMDNFGVTLSPVGMTGAAVDPSALTPYVDIEFPNALASIFDDNTGLPLDKFAISGNDGAIGFIEASPFVGYRRIGGHAPNPQNSEESDVFLQPRILTGKMSDTFGTKLTAIGKMNFEERTFQGIDGYKVYAGLVREAHYVIDGLPTNTILYPGTKAMGAPVEVLPPLVKTVKVGLQVRPKDGVTINSISEIIKSTVASYINRLGVGKPVIVSEIVRIVQGLPGVYSVAITSTYPVATDDRIVVSDIEKTFVLNSATDITVG